MTPEQIAHVEAMKDRVRIEVLVSDELDRPTLSARISELISDFRSIPWKLVVPSGLEREVDEEYQRGEL